MGGSNWSLLKNYDIVSRTDEKKTYVVQLRPQVDEIFQRPLRDYPERHQTRDRNAGRVQCRQERTLDRVVRPQRGPLARFAAKRHPVAVRARQRRHEPAKHNACHTVAGQPVSHQRWWRHIRRESSSLVRESSKKRNFPKEFSFFDFNF